MRYPDSESTVLELKRELPSNDKIVNTLIGFCNQQGGQLVIRVADSGEIIGVTAPTSAPTSPPNCLTVVRQFSRTPRV